MAEAKSCFARAMLGARKAERVPNFVTRDHLYEERGKGLTMCHEISRNTAPLSEQVGLVDVARAKHASQS